jgi:hypothetical protein
LSTEISREKKIEDLVSNRNIRKFSDGNVMEKKPKDHILAIIKAGVSAVPIVGGSVASLIGDYIPTATQKSVEKGIDILKSRLEELGDRIDAEYVDKDEFSELFKTCYLIMVKTHQEKKLQGVAELIANILLKKNDPNKLSYTEIDHFVRCLDALSIGAIEALGHIVVVARTIQRSKIGKENVRINFSGLHNRLPDMNPELLMGLLGELNSFHLVYVTPTPTIRTANHANCPIELPPMGFRFAVYILNTKLK